MSEPTPDSAPVALSLPDAPNLEWLRKQARRRLAELRQATPTARLADAQFDLAKQYGFSSWRALKAHVDSLAVDGQLFDAAKRGDVAALAALLDKYPDRLHARNKPYEWSLLHLAANAGHLAAVDLLLNRGLDANTREKGDNTYAMHWAAAAGHVAVVQRLIDAGGDVVGRGDDHELEVIGWATCWEHGDDAAHRAVADLLIRRGARHHVFSAIALNLPNELRRIVADDPAQISRPMSRNEQFELPLQFAVRKNRVEMVEQLLQLGADPAATDGAGMTVSAYAAAPNVDRSVIEALARHGWVDLFTALALGDHTAVARLVQRSDGITEPGGAGGPLHLLAKRGDAGAVKWLLDHGANPNARWAHWDAEVTALHLAVMGGHVDIIRLLLNAGADPRVRDSKFDSDAIGWAEHFGRQDLARLLRGEEREAS